MIGKGQQIARYQSDIYRNWYRKMLNWLVFTTAVMLVLIIAIIYFVFFPAPASYYATTSSGQILPMTSK